MSSHDKEFEAEDPMALTPAVMDIPMDDAAYRRMAETIVEEYMLLGFSDEKILELFRDPFYRATHQILKNKGESYLTELIQEVRNG